MADEGSGKEGNANFRERIIAVLPHAAIERVHELRLAGQDADRETAANNLAVGGHVRADTENCLGAAGMSTEPGHNFIKDESRACFCRELAQLVQEFAGLKVGMAALHWLHHDSRKFAAVGPNIFERF